MLKSSGSQYQQTNNALMQQVSLVERDWEQKQKAFEAMQNMLADLETEKVRLRSDVEHLRKAGNHKEQTIADLRRSLEEERGVSRMLRDKVGIMEERERLWKDKAESLEERELEVVRSIDSRASIVSPVSRSELSPRRGTIEVAGETIGGRGLSPRNDMTRGRAATDYFGFGAQSDVAKSRSKTDHGQLFRSRRSTIPDPMTTPPVRLNDVEVDLTSDMDD